MADAQKFEKPSRFQEVELADAQKSEKSLQVVFTDGACTDNGKDDARAGIGVFWNYEYDRNVSELVLFEKPQTNGFAEFYAVIRAIETAVSSGLKEIVVNSDSQYVVHGANKWLSGWIKKGWIKSDGNPVKHKFLWKRYLELKKKITVSLVFVRRGTEYGNIQSDLFAKSALNVNLCEDEDGSQIQLSSVLTGYKTLDDTSEENLDITTSLIQASCAMSPEKDDNNMIQCSIYH